MDRRIDILKELLLKKKGEYKSIRRVFNSGIIRDRKRGMKTRPLMPVFEKTILYKSAIEQIKYLENS